MSSPGPWIQPPDLWVTVNRSWGYGGWARQFAYRGAGFGGFTLFSTRWNDVLHGTPAAFAALNDNSTGRSAWQDGGSGGVGGAYTYLRRGWDYPDSSYVQAARLDAYAPVHKVTCAEPTSHPKTYPESYPDDYESLEFEADEGAYHPEHRYRVYYLADAQEAAPPSTVFHVGIKAGGGYEAGVLDRMPDFSSFLLSAGFTEGSGYVDFEIASQVASVAGVPASWLGSPTPDAAGISPNEIIGVGSNTAWSGFTKTFPTWRRYTPPRYRFVYADPTTGGRWGMRQRQTPAGNAGGWPLRQRQHAAATGTHLLRQRQHGS